jgi:hypothetical protein
VSDGFEQAGGVAGGDLDGGVGYAVQIALVVLASGSEFAACRNTEEVVDQRGGFSFGVVAFSFR